MRVIEAESITEMVGRTMVSVEETGKRELVFRDTEGVSYMFHHEQDCCEAVYIEDICGDLSDLVDSPLLVAEETVSVIATGDDSGTATFYRFATVKGTVTVRWLGESNGFYSESVDLQITGR